MPNKSVHRYRDYDTGNCGADPRPNRKASPNVFVNGKGAHRVGDDWPRHCDGDDCHESVTKEGSRTVFVNSKSLARYTDELDCGSTCDVGSLNVFAGGR